MLSIELQFFPSFNKSKIWQKRTKSFLILWKIWKEIHEVVFRMVYHLLSKLRMHFKAILLPRKRRPQLFIFAAIFLNVLQKWKKPFTSFCIPVAMNFWLFFFSYMSKLTKKMVENNMNGSHFNYSCAQQLLISPLPKKIWRKNGITKS